MGSATLALALLASHLVGDFVFQTRWQAVGKFGWTADALALRTAHVFFYGVAFLPVVLWRTLEPHGPATFWRPPAFFAALLVLHWLTDSRRFTSTLGDVAGWWFRTPEERHAEWDGQPGYGKVGTTSDTRPPNPWPPIGLAIDQTLHVVQLAALAWLLT